VRQELSIKVNLVESRKEIDVFIQIGSFPLVKVGSVSTLEGYSVEKLMQPVTAAAGRPSINPKNNRKTYKLKKQRILEDSTEIIFPRHVTPQSFLGELYIQSATQLLYNEGGNSDLWGKPLDPILAKTPFIWRDKILKSIDVLCLKDVNSGNPVFAYKTFRPSESALAWLFWAEQQFLAFSNPQMSRINPEQILVK